MTVTQVIIAALALLLALSTTANAWLGNEYISARQEAALQAERTRQATDAAMQCSSSIGELEDRARAAAARALPVLAAAQAKALSLEQRAQATLAAPATVPGDDCRSARDRLEAWLASRGQP